MAQSVHGYLVVYEYCRPESVYMEPRHFIANDSSHSIHHKPFIAGDNSSQTIHHSQFITNHSSLVTVHQKHCPTKSIRTPPRTPPK